MAQLPGICPNCESRKKFMVDASLFALPQMDKDGNLNLQRFFPLSAVTCMECGLSMFFHVDTAGDIRTELFSKS